MNNNTISILNLEPEGYSSEAECILRNNFFLVNGPLDRRGLLRCIHDYDVIIVRLGHRIDSRVLQRAKKLKVIVSATTGLNHIDLDEAERRCITVLSLKGENLFLNSIHATSEHTWGLLLALVRKLPQAYWHVMSGGWNRDQFKGAELYGRTLGIIGHGRIGTKIAGYGDAFGMEVIGYDANKAQPTPVNLKRMGMDEVLTRSDVVSLHVNYSPQNFGMIGYNEMSMMKYGAMLINTSRGELIDETALIKCLSTGHLGGAALDVLCGEHEESGISKALLDYAINFDNLILTPHIGGCTFDSMEKTEVFMANKLVKHLNKEV